MSVLAGENFREPEHLATMIARLAPDLSKHANVIPRWAAHYGVGILFAAVYVELWESGKIKHTIGNGIILGTISGFLGCLIWKATFKFIPYHHGSILKNIICNAFPPLLYLLFSLRSLAFYPGKWR